MALPLEDLDRLFELALEFKNAGRQTDAELLARVSHTLDGQDDVRLDISDEELERRLAEAEADIAAGRVTPDEEVWARLEAADAETAAGSE